jgi:hypothetical protein
MAGSDSLLILHVNWGLARVVCCAGFDPAGAEEMGGVVTGGCKWIGATEVAAMLRFFGVDARIVDFAVGADDGGGGPGWTWVGGRGGGNRPRTCHSPTATV